MGVAEQTYIRLHLLGGLLQLRISVLYMVWVTVGKEDFFASGSNQLLPWQHTVPIAVAAHSLYFYFWVQTFYIVNIVLAVAEIDEQLCIILVSVNNVNQLADPSVRVRGNNYSHT